MGLSACLCLRVQVLHGLLLFGFRSGIRAEQRLCFFLDAAVAAKHSAGTPANHLLAAAAAADRAVDQSLEQLLPAAVAMARMGADSFEAAADGERSVRTRRELHSSRCGGHVRGQRRRRSVQTARATLHWLQYLWQQVRRSSKDRDANPRPTRQSLYCGALAVLYKVSVLPITLQPLLLTIPEQPFIDAHEKNDDLRRAAGVQAGTRIFWVARHAV